MPATPYINPNAVPQTVPTFGVGASPIAFSNIFPPAPPNAANPATDAMPATVCPVGPVAYDMTRSAFLLKEFPIFCNLFLIAVIISYAE
jgi:hypothetical protein